MDQELLEELRPLFIAEMSQRIGQLREYVTSADIEQVRQLAHKIRGAGGTYGFTEISRHGSVVEEAAKIGDWEIIRAGCGDLETWLTQNN
ncbi:MAG: Hpt domain-containing protein [Candidatus Neomarinimicrobiota bacterium]